MVYVIDTSFILHSESPPKGKLIAPFSVMNELKSFVYKLKAMLWEVEFLDPKEKYIKKVKKEASKIGYLEKLSETDIDVLALALERKGAILTNDFAIQNVARRLGIRFEGEKKIKRYKKRRKRLEERLKG